MCRTLHTVRCSLLYVPRAAAMRALMAAAERPSGVDMAPKYLNDCTHSTADSPPCSATRIAGASTAAADHPTT